MWPRSSASQSIFPRYDHRGAALRAILTREDEEPRTSLRDQVIRFYNPALGWIGYSPRVMSDLEPNGQYPAFRHRGPGQPRGDDRGRDGPHRRSTTSFTSRRVSRRPSSLP